MIEFVVKIKIGIIILLFLNMQQISKNIYQIKLGMVNAFLIEDNGFTLIDTGYKNSSDKIKFGNDDFESNLMLSAKQAKIRMILNR